jgi:hypothetical protein
MDEATWLACQAPKPMLDFLSSRASKRKLRLFAVACCRQVSHLLTDLRSRKALDAAEQYADGLAPLEELRRAETAAQPASPKEQGARAAAMAASEAVPAGWVARETAYAVYAVAREAWVERWEQEWHGQAGLVRDIFGNVRFAA